MVRHDKHSGVCLFSSDSPAERFTCKFKLKFSLVQPELATVLVALRAAG